MTRCATASLALLLLLAPGSLRAQARRTVPVQIHSEPEGALVRLGERRLGRTPIARVHLPVGPNELLFEHPDAASVQVAVDVRRRDQRIGARLSPGTGVRVLAGNADAWASTVRIDGRVVGRVPLERFVRAGRHEVVVERDGFFPTRRWVDLEEGETLPVVMSLEPREAAPTPTQDGAPAQLPAPLVDEAAARSAGPAQEQTMPPSAGAVHAEAGSVASEHDPAQSAGTAQAPGAPAQGSGGLTGTGWLLIAPSARAPTAARIDGVAIGVGRTVAELPVGPHRVEAEFGDERLEVSVDILEGHQRVVVLEPPRPPAPPARAGVLRVTATAQAWVMINGVSRGRTPVELTPPPGRYDVRVIAPEHRDVRQTCRIAPGRDCTVRALMRSR